MKIPEPLTYTFTVCGFAERTLTFVNAGQALRWARANAKTLAQMGVRRMALDRGAKVGAVLDCAAGRWMIDFPR